jgi:hypothetical protein
MASVERMKVQIVALEIEGIGWVECPPSPAAQVSFKHSYGERWEAETSGLVPLGGPDTGETVPVDHPTVDPNDLPF